MLGGFGFGGVVTGPFDMDRSVLASQGVSEWVLAIQVRNRGRMPVDVGSFEVEFESGGAYDRAGWHVNPNMPYRLDPGSSQSFYVPSAGVENALEIMNPGRRGAWPRRPWRREDRLHRAREHSVSRPQGIWIGRHEGPVLDAGGARRNVPGSQARVPSAA